MPGYISSDIIEMYYPFFLHVVYKNFYTMCFYQDLFFCFDSPHNFVFINMLSYIVYIEVL